MDKKYMERALELAHLGLGKTSPNPMVGCVIVKNDKIIGEGWHKNFGGPHAEVYAINHVEKKDMITGSDVYVSLEPCSHHGKTPPCTDLLIKNKVGRVFISNMDINPKVNGRGVEKLKAAGIEVVTDILYEKGRLLNKRFFNFYTYKRPYIILKWAQTADGFIARENYDSKWISNEYSRQMVHKWRSEEDAIMVGANTVKYDNPSLTVRDWEGKHPIRIIIDPNLKSPENRLVFDKSIMTYVYNYKTTRQDLNLSYIKIEEKNFLPGVIHHLHSINIQSVLVEGGSFLLNSFFKLGIWDEARVFSSMATFGAGIRAPELIDAELHDQKNIFDDQLRLFKSRKENV